MASTEIVLLAYPDFTALDLLGPHHVLAAMPNSRARVVAATRGTVRSDLGLIVSPDCATADVERADILVIPGGTYGTTRAMQDSAILDFVKRVATSARWVMSICTGSLIVGAAGLLRGKRATSHWMALPLLPSFGATPVAERVVWESSLLTCAGVTAGIDGALQLVERECGQEFARLVTLGSEYDPEPPFDAGTPMKAGPASTATLRAALQPWYEETRRIAKTAAL